MIFHHIQKTTPSSFSSSFSTAKNRATSGFDSFHGHKTSYRDFIHAVKESNSNNLWIVYFDKLVNIHGWIDIENEFYNIITLFSDFSTKNIRFNINSKIDISYLNLFECFGFEFSYASEAYTEKYMQSKERKVRTRHKVNYNYIKLTRQTYEFTHSSILNYNAIQNKMISDFIELKNYLKNTLKNLQKQMIAI